jgi:hypothetical protein
MKRVNKNKIVDVLTFFYLLLALLTILVLGHGCVSNLTYRGEIVSGVVRVPTKITSYPLEDYKGELHKYRENFDSFIFPRHNNKLTQYCAFHFEWEDIKAVYKKGDTGEWGYVYVVSKNKKS